jgi:hypothetical protein
MTSMVIILVGAPGDKSNNHHPLPPEVIDEFEALMSELHLYNIRRPGWDRIKTILAIATMEAGDTEKGSLAYDLASQKWRRSRWYDGAD